MDGKGGGDPYPECVSLPVRTRLCLRPGSLLAGMRCCWSLLAFYPSGVLGQASHAGLCYHRHSAAELLGGIWECWENLASGVPDRPELRG